MNYQVIVDAFGTVYSGDDRIKAEKTYHDYVRMGTARIELHSDNELLFSHSPESDSN